MKKLRFINKLTSKTEQEDECSKEPSEPSQPVVSDQKKHKAEYRETLYANEDVAAPSFDSFRFRNVEHIESTVDTLHHRSSRTSESDIERRVDSVLSKQQTQRSRKPANVIYVVSKPTPGQVRGDWAVRSHGKIYSHHRTKENAIKNARQIASEKEATVLVQNMDGTFRTSYKPKTKKE
ncbi:MAG: DUF2188 domain-containing protein [Candidatus Thermoplasmatota archaeon]|nr:DUF2188 domain-containing protein [Candidatus Thermoplasmatota archaeon]